MICICISLAYLTYYKFDHWVDAKGNHEDDDLKGAASQSWSDRTAKTLSDLGVRPEDELPPLHRTKTEISDAAGTIPPYDDTLLPPLHRTKTEISEIPRNDTFATASLTLSASEEEEEEEVVGVGEGGVPPPVGKGVGRMLGVEVVLR